VPAADQPAGVAAVEDPDPEDPDPEAPDPEDPDPEDPDPEDSEPAPVDDPDEAAAAVPPSLEAAPDEAFDPEPDLTGPLRASLR
jgi:hypothetical protein